MATITVSDKVYQALNQRAELQGVSLCNYIEKLALESNATNEARENLSPSPDQIDYHQWKARYEQWQDMVRERSVQYPPGFHADDDRESIY